MFSWAPDGTINLVPGIIGGTETSDGENLNLSINDLVADGLDVRYSDNGATFSNFAAITGLLPVGTYTISLFTQESQLVDKVPEPATLALVGLGMLGMRFAGRRRKHV
jgi:PEP-CTERM motif